MKKDIKVDATRLDNNQIQMNVTVYKEDVADYIAKSYRKAAKEYRIPGFRPGKAPRKVLDNSLGKQYIFAQATDMLLDDAYPMAVNAEGINVLGEPNLETDELVKEGIDYIFHVELNVKPEVELTSYDPVTVKMPPEELTDEELQEQIDTLRGYYYTLEDDEDHEVGPKDFVVVDLETTREGEDVPELCVTDRIYELGRASIPYELEEALVGMNPGETKEVSYIPAVNEEKVDSKVTVKGLKRKVLPEFDDEFAKKSGYETTDELVDALKTNLSASKARTLPQLKEDRAIIALQKRVIGEPSALQKSLIYTDLLKQFFNQLQREGGTLDAYLASRDMTVEQFEEDMHKQAEDTAYQELALDSLARQQEIEVTVEELIAEFEAAGADDPVKSIEEWEKAGRMSALRETLRRAKAARWVVETAIVEEEVPGESDEEEEAPAAEADPEAEAEEAAEEETAE